MGAQGSRSEGVLQSVNPNGKTLEFLVELCSSWGYNSIVANVKKNLFAELNNKGYEIKYVFEPLSGGNGEFYIYETSLNGKRLIFSNDQSKKEKQTVVGRNLNNNNIQNVIKAILE